MEYFYENLEKGLNKDEALRQAQLKYLARANPEGISPQYWAGIILVGNDTVLQALQNHWWHNYWLLLPIFALVIGLVFWIKRKK